jgi:hypothetical protein
VPVFVAGLAHVTVPIEARPLLAEYSVPSRTIARHPRGAGRGSVDQSMPGSSFGSGFVVGTAVICYGEVKEQRQGQNESKTGGSKSSIRVILFVILAPSSFSLCSLFSDWFSSPLFSASAFEIKGFYALGV